MAAGRWPDAVRGYIGARRHPLPVVRATADLMLGTILTEHLGQREHGMRALDHAWRSRHPAVAHVAAHGLARLHLQGGDRAQARRLYHWAWRHGEGTLSWRSAAALIRILQDDGDNATARRLLGSLQRSAGAANSADGWLTVATLHRDRGDAESAETAYRAALDAGATDTALVHGLLGRVLSEQGKLEPSMLELERAVVAGATARVFFMYELARVNERLGDREGACDAYAEVLQVTDNELQNLKERDEPLDGAILRTDPRPGAAVRLGRLRESMGELDAARDALAYATEHGSATVAATAWLTRARLERRAGDRSAARAAYANAIHVRGGAYPAAELGLAQLLISAKQLPAAQQMLDRLVGCGDQRIASLAAVQRGELLTALGDTAAARASYETALAGPLSAGVRARVEQALSG
jgi:predicted negative regulator of RcsB-dependent stress response